jgi:hypothetical protein
MVWYRKKFLQRLQQPYSASLWLEVTVLRLVVDIRLLLISWLKLITPMTII